MKISIVRITPQDTLNIIIDAVRKALNERVFLILPEGNDILHSDIGLETLFKKSLEYGKQLIVSVPDKFSLDRAKKAGLVATTNTDIFSLDYTLWQEASNRLQNYKARAAYDTTFARDPSPQEVLKHQSLTSTTSRTKEVGNSLIKKNSLVGYDVSSITKPQASVKTFSKQAVKTGRSKIEMKLEAKKGGKNVGLLLGIGFSVFLMIGVFFFWIYYQFFPRVEITITLPQEKIVIKDTVLAKIGIEGAQVSKKEFALQSYEVEKSGAITEKTTKEERDGVYATGQITVENTGTNELTINIGQIFTSSSGLQFKALQSVTIPAGATETINVQAVDYGEQYNLPAGQTFTIEGIGDGVSYNASNSAPFSGGQVRTFKVVSKEQVDKATKKLKEQLFNQAKVALKDALKEEGFLIIDKSIKNITPKDVKFEIEPKIGQEASEFTVSGVVRVRALYYHEPSLEALLRDLIIEEYRKKINIQDKEINITLQNFKYQIEEISIKTDKAVEFKVTAEAYIVPSIDRQHIKSLIKGQPLPEARNTIENQYGSVITTYQISYVPEWMPEFLRKVPNSENRISVTIMYTAVEINNKE